MLPASAIPRRLRRGGTHDHVAVRVFALGLRHEAGLENDVVHDLALKRVHRRERNRLARLAHLRDDLAGLLCQLLLATRAEIRDVKHETADVARLRLDREAREVLQRVENLAVGSN